MDFKPRHPSAPNTASFRSFRALWFFNRNRSPRKKRKEVSPPKEVSDPGNGRVNFREDPGEGCSKPLQSKTKSAWSRIRAFLRPKNTKKSKTQKGQTSGPDEAPDFLRAPAKCPTGLEDPQEGCSKQPERAASISQPFPSSKTSAMTEDSFNFHSILGKGGFGKVLLATSCIRQERVAVKVLKKRGMVRHRCHIMLEHDILQQTSGCPFLIQGYAAFQSTDYIYYVMELATGGMLRQLIRSLNKLPTPVVRFLAAELVCGIQFLHSKGIVHRDLKPDNILLAGDGHVKITDFGIALRNVFGKRKKYGGIGTLGYKSPEMILRLPYDEGIDWFAFGVVLYEMLTGRHPFRQSTVMATNEMIIRKEPSYLGLGLQETNLLQQLLCKDQSERLGVHGDIRMHPFFQSIEWEKLEAGSVTSPLKSLPGVMGPCPNTTIRAPSSEGYRTPLGGKQQRLFQNIGFVCPEWARHYHNKSSHASETSSQFP